MGEERLSAIAERDGNRLPAGLACPAQRALSRIEGVRDASGSPRDADVGDPIGDERRANGGAR